MLGREQSPTLVTLLVTSESDWSSAVLAIDSLEKIRDDFDLLVVVDAAVAASDKNRGAFLAFALRLWLYCIR